jgi:WD40 repeat protein
LVSGGKDGSVCLWDIKEQPFEIEPVIRTNVSSFRFTPDSSGVLTVGRNGCIARLEGPGFQEEQTILCIDPNSDSSRSLISTDTRLLAVALKEDKTKEDSAIEVWDLQSASVLHRIPCQPSTEPIAFLAQGRKLVTFKRDGGSHDVWDLATGQRAQSWTGAAELSRYVSPVFSTDEHFMLTLRFFKAPGLLRDMTTARQTDLDLDITETSGISFSPDGKLLAASSHLGYVKLWKAEGFREVDTLRGFLLGAHSVAFSPDSKRLAAGSDDQEAVKIWDVESREELLTLPGQGAQHWEAAFSPDGDTLATRNSAGQLHLWHAPYWDQIERAEASLQQAGSN